MKHDRDQVKGHAGWEPGIVEGLKPMNDHHLHVHAVGSLSPLVLSDLLFCPISNGPLLVVAGHSNQSSTWSLL